MSKVSNISLYVGTYRKYNDGNCFGEWLDLTNYADAEDFLETCCELHSDEDDPEVMFQDCENIPDALYCESCSKSNIEELYRYIDKCNEYGQDIVDAVLDNGDSLDEVEEVYYLCEDDMLNQDENIGMSYVDQLCGVENLDKETLIRFFDFEAFGRAFRQDVNVFQSGHKIYYRYY